MMDRFDDGTLFMSQVEGMIGSETNDAIRMRIARENSKQLLTVKEKGEQCSEPFKNRSPELELDIELEKDIDKENIGFTSVLDTPIQNGCTRIETARKAWNESKAGPECRLMAITLPPQDREDCLRVMTAYSDADVVEAICNYKNIRASPEHEVSAPYRSFAGFMRGGVEKFVSTADPFTAYKIKGKFEKEVQSVAGRGDAKTAEEIREHREAIENNEPLTVDELRELESIKAKAMDNPIGRALVNMLGRP
jgi:hypothetical protein